MLHIPGISHIKKIIIIICLSVMFLTLAIPQQNAAATSGVGKLVNPVQSLSLRGDFAALKMSLNRNEDKIGQLSKNRLKIMAMVERLRSKNNKNWVGMRTLYYDFNSSYQLAISHAHDGRLLLLSHPGFSASGKVENESMARWTVQRLRGVVTGLIARINECGNIMRKANKLMQSSR
jgi:hypothetical protein